MGGQRVAFHGLRCEMCSKSEEDRTKQPAW